MNPNINGASKRLLVVDAHPIVRYGIRHMFEQVPEVTVCGEAENGRSALEAMRALNPDLVLMEVAMPGMNGIELIKLMLSERPLLKILMLSNHDESLYALRALRAGAKGYLTKAQPLEHIGDALRSIIEGATYVSREFSERLVFKAVQGSESDLGTPVDKLSDRELEVLQLLGCGKTTREIAAELHVSVKTIETHRAHIKEKLGFKDAKELVRFATEWRASGEGVNGG